MGTAEIARYNTLDEANGYLDGAYEANKEFWTRLLIFKEDNGTYSVNID